MRCYVIELPPGLFPQDINIDLYHGTESSLRAAVRSIKEFRGKHWVYINISATELDVNTSKVALLNILNGDPAHLIPGNGTLRVVREWETTPRGGIRPKRNTSQQKNA